MNDTTERRLRRALQRTAAAVPPSVPEKWAHPTSRTAPAGASRRRTRLALASAAVVIVGLSSALWANSQSSPPSSSSPIGAVGATPQNDHTARLGPGCGIPAVDLGLPTAPAAAREGKPLITGAVGAATTIRVMIDPTRPHLKVTATVIVAAPGTLPGRGFVNPDEAVGKPTLDDPNTWLASIDVDAQSTASTRALAFVPKEPGLYPVYVVEHASATTPTPPLCGGIPDKGGEAQNVVGWIEVR